MRFTASILLALAASVVVVDAAKKKPSTTIDVDEPINHATDLSPSPTVVCEDDQSELVITVLTDFFPEETSWKLKKRNEFSEWQIVATKDDFYGTFNQYSDKICIGSGDTYRWVIEDSYGDGLLCDPNYCGAYSITLDGYEIASGSKFGFKYSAIFTGGDCVDGEGEFRFVQPNGSDKKADWSCANVADYLDLYPGQAEKGCRAKGVNGGLLLDYCAETCGIYGYGRRGRCCDQCVETETPSSFPTDTPTSYPTYSPGPTN